MNYFKVENHIFSKDLKELPTGSMVELVFEGDYRFMAYIKDGAIYEARIKDKIIDKVDDGILKELRLKNVEIISIKDFSTEEDKYVPHIMFKYPDGKIRPFSHVSEPNERVKVWVET